MRPATLLGYLAIFGVPGLALFRRDDDQFKGNGKPYEDPADKGGRMLTIINGTHEGEPLNVILSANSDPAVLKDSEDLGGFRNYMLSTELAAECLGMHFGLAQKAALDGAEAVDEFAVLRWMFGDPYIGSCRETFEGGLHLRYWRQKSTGAYFMAVSSEMPLDKFHDIIPNGYNIGRDQLVGNVTKHAFDTRSVTNETVITGQSSFKNYTYETRVEYHSGLLKNSSDDVNHWGSVPVDGFPAIDGLVAVLTVKIIDTPFGPPSLAKEAAAVANPSPYLGLLVLTTALFALLC